jgi:outer membrane lipoprotein-sorting protein
MKKTLRVFAGIAKAVLAAACALALSAAPAAPPDPAEAASSALTAEQIVDRSVDVRGGLPAWNKVATIIWTGHLESQRSAIPSLPFRLEEKRPAKSRFEITEPSQRSLRVFNGASGWKMKLSQDGRPEVKPFTAQEIRFARSAPGLEGPLIDFRARGSSVELEGTEEIDGRKSYRIGVRLSTGERQTVWIDAESFLESRYDRTVYDTAGAKGTISVRLREYREVEGLAVPSVIEISGAAGGRPDRMVIERVALNPEIDDRQFDGLGASRGRAAAEPGSAAK